MKSKEENKSCNDYTAIKLSSNPEGIEDPTRSGFKSENAAWRYAARWFCSGCRHKMAVALYWERKYGINPHDAKVAVCQVLESMITKTKKPYMEGSSLNNLDMELEMDMENLFGDASGDACGCEWMVLPTEKAEKCENFGDIMDAAGAVRIH